jgi:hypothetical protein
MNTRIDTYNYREEPTPNRWVTELSNTAPGRENTEGDARIVVPGAILSRAAEDEH